MDDLVMDSFIPTYLGSVNSWECDENDHLNVRFYVQKMQQTLEAGLLETKLASNVTLKQICQNISVQHMRFGAEARMAEPITGYFGLLSVDADCFSVLVELRNSSNDQVIASFTYDINYALTRTYREVIPLPAHAGSRGVESRPLPYINLSLAECGAFGFHTIGKGVIQPDECCHAGFLLRCHYMGRSSDSVPNLLMRFAAEIEEGSDGAGIAGSAVLEYRMSYYSPLRVGDRFEIRSGLLDVGEKIYRLAHLVFNSGTGKLVLGSESVSINMDLSIRKSVPIALPQRQIMERLLLTKI
ncbi:MAG: thioesterase family protein [Pseudomonadales bacterium]|nr:thioesterase family protein [Pseudomonadales bacterium]